MISWSALAAGVMVSFVAASRGPRTSAPSDARTPAYCSGSAALRSQTVPPPASVSRSAVASSPAAPRESRDAPETTTGRSSTASVTGDVPSAPSAAVASSATVVAGRSSSRARPSSVATRYRASPGPVSVNAPSGTWSAPSAVWSAT